MLWDKQDCPLCGGSGEAWSASDSGSYKLTKCNHFYDTKTFVYEMQRLAASAIAAQKAYDDVVEQYNKAKEK